MATYDDIARNQKLREDLQDELKPGGIDLLLPYADFESGWIQLTRGNSVTLNHNLGSHPRLVSMYSNAQADFTSTCIYEIGADPDTSFAIVNVSDTHLTIINDSKSTTFKFIYLRLWK